MPGGRKWNLIGVGRVAVRNLVALALDMVLEHETGIGMKERSAEEKGDLSITAEMSTLCERSSRPGRVCRIAPKLLVARMLDHLL
jgi:hypothetical protein